ncbi:2,3-diaminopropionate biosynthesis protein SbnB [Nocardia aurantiaca]|uniref:2,3-diaminopropionate biosynthesis protein SbnB n=1 Tax=Nocardia aurantiaca TaxID=2675850 RepID=A0A6I3L4S2_9NOCA|nr:2,3-diaminopropionate biosynthesis protein SbnB [Nocardia aurantiaca]MTE15664.1 2,3-diaminopropionate biosynthesis protein SbnB [Nocardia aurantiaca]
MLILSSQHVNQILAGHEKDVLEVVSNAYLSHARGHTAVPHSSFLRFPHNPDDRIISLAAYLGDEQPVAGTKWIASYPANVSAGLPRASAVMILNSTRTGQPVAVLEASRISAWRTAASAALGAKVLLGEQPPCRVSLIGAGLINAEILRFLRHTVPGLREVTVHDVDPQRAADFAEQTLLDHPDLAIHTTTTLTEALTDQPLVSFATTAATPYTDLDATASDAVILHVSLRDLTTETILSAHNVVDDADHVCRAQTSVHLAEQSSGHRGFIAADIGTLLAHKTEPPTDRRKIFSPFGLGVLDIAVARYVLDRARENGVGHAIDGFLPAAG